MGHTPRAVRETTRQRASGVDDEDVADLDLMLLGTSKPASSDALLAVPLLAEPKAKEPTRKTSLPRT